MLENVAPFLCSKTHPQRCVGCGRQASDVLCRGCFEALPGIGRPVCARCGAPTAFEAFACDACKAVDFGFEGARAPLRYEGVGEEAVHALKYGGYTRVATGSPSRSWWGCSTAASASTPLCPCRCTARGLGAAASTRRSSWRVASLRA